MVDPIKTNTQFKVPLKPSSQLNGPVVRPSASPEVPPRMTAPTPRPPAVPQLPKPASDTIELSQAAQARYLHQEGMSIPDIALQLKLDITTVNSFFPK
jgi:hypothetical protein